MADRYLQFVQNTFGRALAKRLGLPLPARLARYVEGNRFLAGKTLVGFSGAAHFKKTIELLTRDAQDRLDAEVDPATDEPLKTVLYDATGISTSRDLTQLYQFFHPIIKSFGPCARIVLIGWSDGWGSANQQTAQRAIVGFVKSLAKEMRAGGTVNLIRCAGECHEALTAPLAFFASDRSAYVSGQVIQVLPASVEKFDFVRPLDGKNVLVTGAARGIGLAIARLVRTRGGNPICLDVPHSESELRRAAGELNADYVPMDITAEDAGRRIEQHLGEKPLHAIVHNAGITRDKKLVNMKPENWELVMRTNLICQESINETLLASGHLTSGGRIVTVSSISGIAGNAGQTNYSTSKAGVIGMVMAYCQTYFERGITINAVAPGFIETQMVRTMPFALRQAGRRFNSLGQGGLPEDVAEGVALFLQPSSQGLAGNILRVCGQALIGA